MKNRKIVALVLAGVISLSGISILAACGGDNSQVSGNTQTVNNTNNEAQNIGQETFDKLNKSYQVLLNISSDIREAWYQCIYKDEIKTSTLAPAINLPRTYLQQGSAYIAEEIGIKNTVDNLYKSDDYIWVMGLLDKTTSIIYSVLQGYFIKGDITQLDEDIEAAKNNIKTLTQTYTSYNYTDKLNDMYTAVKQFNDFCQSPTGSFSTFDGTVNGYKTSYSTAKTSLSIIFE